MAWQLLFQLDSGNHYYRAPNGRIAVLGRRIDGQKEMREETLWVDRRRPLVIETDVGERFVEVPLFAEGQSGMVTIERAETAVALSRALGLRLERTVRGGRGRDA